MNPPEPVENFEVVVEETDRGWIVVSIADGVRKEIGDPHPDRETAEFHARNVADGAQRWDGSASTDPPS